MMGMIVLAAVGVALLLAAPLLARLFVGREGDATGATRILQVLAALLLVVALLFRPHQDETAAFPPPPDAPGGR
jgi:hypothetical protein